MATPTQWLEGARLRTLPAAVSPVVAGSGGLQNEAQLDILQALVALGYSDKEAQLALKALPPDVGVSEGIKLALKALAR